MGRNFFSLIVLITILPLYSVSQDCDIQREPDPYTKELKLTTGFINLKNTRLSIQADSREIDFFFVISGKDNCFSDASTATVLFEGSKVKLSIRNSGSMNCDGFFHFVFKNQAVAPSSLKRMTSQKIIGIVFTGNEKNETQISLNTDQQIFLMNNISCLVDEAKKLLRG